jgi:hypothetical protein
MSVEDNHSGIPTRAIHEAYLDMQRALKSYREAKDQQHQAAIQQAHGELQQAVMTFYELMRPHLKQEQALKPYWEGKLPNYTKNGTPPEPDDGKGILQVQEKNDSFGFEDVEVPQSETLDNWHQSLGFNGNKRIQGIYGMGDSVFVTWHEYQTGLKHLDSSETSYKRHVKPKDGFMGDKTETEVQRQRIPIDRLKSAARELSDAAKEIDFLSQTGVPTNDDTRPI